MAKSEGRGAPCGTGMLLLALLERRDMYGYEMVEALRAQSKEIFHLKAGTLYPLLHTLEAQGWVKAYEKAAENGKKRRYYRITSAGKKQLTAERRQWEEFTGSVEKVIGGGARAFA